jgi:hypothetical protein
MEDQQHVTAWWKSSRSGSNGGGCVEVALADPDGVMVRDSRLGDASPVLTMTRAEWRTFVGSLPSDRRPG